MKKLITFGWDSSDTYIREAYLWIDTYNFYLIITLFWRSGLFLHTLFASIWWEGEGTVVWRLGRGMALRVVGEVYSKWGGYRTD